MEKQVDKNFVWLINNFASYHTKNYYSDPFLIAGSRWRLLASPKENNLEFFYLYLGAVDRQSLPSRWKRHVKLCLNIINRLSIKLSIVTELYFDEKSFNCRYPSILPLPNFLAKDGGFLINGELRIVVEVVAHKVIGTSGESIISKSLRIEGTHGAKSIDLLNETQQVKESMDVNGFQVLPSQVKSVKRIFERYPDIASGVRPKKRCLRTTYMNVLLGLIETVCQLPEELSDDDLDEASVAVSFVAKGGFKLDWLEKKLEEVKAKKEKVKTSKARLQQMEEELQKFNQKCLDLKNLLEKENADMSEANVPLSFDDVV